MPFPRQDTVNEPSKDGGDDNFAEEFLRPTDVNVGTEAFVNGTRTLPGERGARYFEYGYGMSPKETREILEALMTTANWPVYSPFAKIHYGKGRDEGRTEGEQQALLEVLSARGLHATEDERARIVRCTDPAQLMAWLRKSPTVSAVSELFD